MRALFFEAPWHYRILARAWMQATKTKLKWVKLAQIHDTLCAHLTTISFPNYDAMMTNLPCLLSTNYKKVSCLKIYCNTENECEKRKEKKRIPERLSKFPFLLDHDIGYSCTENKTNIIFRKVNLRCSLSCSESRLM